jgi:hypothetical protein
LGSSSSSSSSVAAVALRDTHPSLAPTLVPTSLPTLCSAVEVKFELFVLLESFPDLFNSSSSSANELFEAVQVCDGGGGELFCVWWCCCCC